MRHRRWDQLRAVATGSAGLLVLGMTGCDEPASTTRPATPATTQAAPAPDAGDQAASTTQASGAPINSWTELLRVLDPELPADLQAEGSVELSAAARFESPQPLSLDARGDLWITHPRGRSVDELLAEAFRDQVHVVRERVVFARWSASKNLRRPEPVPEVFVLGDDGTTRVHALLDTYLKPIEPVALAPGLERNWSRAFAWGDGVVVPTSTGVSFIRVERVSDLVREVEESHVVLCEPGAGHETHVAIDWRGLIAWSTHQDREVAANVARYVDGAWTTLADRTAARGAERGAWPERLVHLAPLLDGTVLTLSQEGSEIRVGVVAVEPVPVDPDRVRSLVKQLADPDPTVRESSQVELASLGPGAWPTLGELVDEQLPEARLRIGMILGDKSTPTLGGLKPERGDGRLVARLRDGGVVLFLRGGVSGVVRGGVTRRFAPVYLAVRPGRAPMRLDDGMFRDVMIGRARLGAWGDEYVVEHELDGLLRWIGNHFEPLTPRKLVSYNRLLGIDARGRWLLKADDADGPTLVIDPTIVNPAPRLPMWALDVAPGKSGWDADGWAAMERGGVWSFRGSSWAALPKEANLETHVVAAARVPGVETPILTGRDGATYFDGLTTLQRRTPDGRAITWTLPPELTGNGVPEGTANLFEDAAGRLYLVNAPGRVVRLKVMPDGSPEPFKVEAVFAKHLPATNIRRVWQDPAGHIIFASGTGRLTICFPAGRIPQHVQNLIPNRELFEAGEE